jgi:DNA-binding response OmpR family regulator
MPDDPSVEMSDILIVEDNENNIDTLRLILKGTYAIRVARNGSTALQLVDDELPEIILLDIGLPDINGIEVCRQLKARPEMRDIPIVFLTAFDDDNIRRDAFAAGGIDYITKPFQIAEVLARVKAHWSVRAYSRYVEQLHTLEREYLVTLLEIRNEVISDVSHDLKNPIQYLRQNRV